MRLALALLLVCSTAHAQTPMAGAMPVQTRMRFGVDTVPPPLNASLEYRRTLDGDQNGGALGGTAQALGLYMESLHGTLLHPWAFYAELRTSNGGVANGVVMYARLRNEGSAWGAGIHSEVIASGPSTTIGVNVEPSPMTGAGRVIGINVQAVDGYGDTHPHIATNEGINLQTGLGASFVDGIRFNGTQTTTGIHFDTGARGTRAIWIEGLFATGIDLGSSPLRMNGGTPIMLEAGGRIQIVYGSGRIWFKNGSRVLGYLVVDASASGGRLN